MRLRLWESPADHTVLERTLEKRLDASPKVWRNPCLCPCLPRVKEADFVEEGKKNLLAMKNMLHSAPWETLWFHSDENVTVKSFYDSEIQRTAFLVETTLNIDPERLFEEDRNLAEDISTWNPNVAQSSVIQDNAPSHRAQVYSYFLQEKPTEVLPHPSHFLDLASRDFWLFGKLTKTLRKMGENCQIIRQITAPLANGFIWSRDFILLNYWDRDGEKMHSCIASTTWPHIQASDNYVLATCYPGGFTYSPSREEGKTFLQWIYNMDLYLPLVPDAILNNILPSVFKEFLGHYRTRVHQIVART
ncbi:unnamed protein product [Darwinula stevensoni]|uniref:START domain-containing protein n=1 Tax=Darwinula stevensoni TaxID=69355 RepID=A0A7R9ADF2_9CRUS|nr:unnamed protein product [Darwinula stevensoni]CAG0901248.1 unnamed protein product [Darwinula stevensoni]